MDRALARCSLLMVVALLPRPAGADAPPTAADAGSPWGVSTSAALNQVPETWVTQMAAAGVTSVRGFDTRRGAPALTPISSAGLSISGILSWSPGRELTLPVDDLEGFRRYVIEEVTRYKGRVTHWEVWNEPPNFTLDRSPVSYGKVVAVAYDAAKSVDPTIQIGLAAKSVHINYLARSIEAGARGKYDFISLHPYETAALVPQGWEGPYLGIVPSVRAMLRDKDPAKQDVPVWFTEIGVESTEVSGREGVSSAVQADTLVKLFTMGIAQGAGQVHWFDPRDSEGKGHGLLRGDGTPREAHHALATLTQQLGRVPKYLGTLAPVPGALGFLFEGVNGDTVVTWKPTDPPLRFHASEPITIVDPRTGQSRQADSVAITASPVLLVAQRGRPIAGAWRRTRSARFPTWDGGPLTRTVSLKAGQKPRGLHMVNAPAPSTVRGVAELSLAGTNGARFAVDPQFFGYAGGPLRITAVVRGHGRGKPGFNLKYEYSGPLDAADDFGMVSTGNWNFVNGERPTKLTWKIDDARFVGKYAIHFAIDCDSAEFADFSLLSVSVTKL